MTMSQTLRSLTISLAVAAACSPMWNQTVLGATPEVSGQSMVSDQKDTGAGGVDAGNVDNEVVVRKAKRDLDKAERSAAAISYDVLNPLLDTLGKAADPKTREWEKAAETAVQVAEQYAHISQQAKVASQRFGEASKSVGMAAQTGSGKGAGDIVQQAMADSNLQPSIDDAANELEAAQKANDKQAAAVAEEKLGIFLSAKETAENNIKQICGQGDLNVAGGSTAGWDLTLASAGAEMAVLSAESAANAYLYRQMANGLRLLDTSERIRSSYSSGQPNPGQVAAATLFKTIRGQLTPKDGNTAIEPASHDQVQKYMQQRRQATQSPTPTTAPSPAPAAAR